MSEFRTGFGYDVHRLERNEEFWLGGIKLQYNKGTTGHSDADVLIHAICDSLLGAANLGDIGIHFPDTSDEYKNIDSKILLKKTTGLITEKGYTICNIDTTVVLQKPKISPVISKMKNTLAEVMNISTEKISIKAKTTERLGFEGREKGVSAYAVALISKDIK